jgi:hypothetical protein
MVYNCSRLGSLFGMLCNMGQQEALEKAKKALVESFSASYSDIKLEEIYFDDIHKWSFTLSFSVPADVGGLGNIGKTLLTGMTARKYRVVKVDKNTGNVVSITMRKDA